MTDITVVESHLQGKNPINPDLCEDMIVVTSDFVAVIDGATDKTGWQQGGKLGGRVAAESIARTLESLPADISARDAVALMNRNLRNHCPDAPTDGPSASIAVYSKHRNELWRLGDVNWRLPDSARSSTDRKLVDTVAANMRAAVIAAALKDGKSVDSLRKDDIGRDAIMPLLTRQHAFRNHESEWGYGAIDGHRTPDSFIEVTPLTSDDRTVILASDGYQKIETTLHDTEAELRDQLARDPLCVNELRGTKGIARGNDSFDDRAYILLRLD